VSNATSASKPKPAPTATRQFAKRRTTQAPRPSTATLDNTVTVVDRIDVAVTDDRDVAFATKKQIPRSPLTAVPANVVAVSSTHVPDAPSVTTPPPATHATVVESTRRADVSPAVAPPRGMTTALGVTQIATPRPRHPLAQQSTERAQQQVDDVQADQTTRDDATSPLVDGDVSAVVDDHEDVDMDETNVLRSMPTLDSPLPLHALALDDDTDDVIPAVAATTHDDADMSDATDVLLNAPVVGGFDDTITVQPASIPATPARRTSSSTAMSARRAPTPSATQRPATPVRAITPARTTPARASTPASSIRARDNSYLLSQQIAAATHELRELERVMAMVDARTRQLRAHADEVDGAMATAAQERSDALARAQRRLAALAASELDVFATIADVDELRADVHVRTDDVLLVDLRV
jgi:hypothetical protein